MAPDTATVDLSALDRKGVVEIDKPDEDDLRLWSVTALLNALAKPGLDIWKERQGPTFACEEYLDHKASAPWVSRLLKEGVGSAVKYLTAFRWPSDELAATETGTAVHSACEQYVITGQRPDREEVEGFMVAAQERRSPNDRLSDPEVIATEAQTIEAMLDQFEGWLDRFQPRYLAAEVTIFSPTYGYAGTSDGFLEIEVPWIFDIKTSRDDVDGRGRPKGPYPEAALQLAAYRYAEMAAPWRARRFEHYRRRYYALSPTEQEMAVPVPPVEGGLVLYITPERCEAYPVRCDESVFESFLAVVDAARWSYELSKDAVAKQALLAGG